MKSVLRSAVKDLRGRKREPNPTEQGSFIRSVPPCHHLHECLIPSLFMTGWVLHGVFRRYQLLALFLSFVLDQKLV